MIHRPESGIIISRWVRQPAALTILSKRVIMSLEGGEFVSPLEPLDSQTIFGTCSAAIAIRRSWLLFRSW